MRRSILLVAALALAAAVRAYPPIPKPDIGTKQHPPTCNPGMGRVVEKWDGKDAVVCHQCPKGQNVKPDGYCGQCSADDTVMEGKCFTPAELKKYNACQADCARPRPTAGPVNLGAINCSEMCRKDFGLSFRYF